MRRGPSQARPKTSTADRRVNVKQGSTLPDLAQELQRQLESKADYLADTRRLAIENIVAGEDAWPVLKVDEEGTYAITDLAHRQIGDRLGIPAKYYDRMRAGAPDLLQRNVNHWFANSPEQRLVRVLDGRVRAFLSDRYRPLDNYDLADAVLPTLMEAGATIHSCEVTDTKMYLKAVVEPVTETVPPPPSGGAGRQANVVVNPGIVISNSEVGMGALQVQPAIHWLRCTNMATWAQGALRKYHVGRLLGEGNGDADGLWRFYSDETRQLADAAVWAQVRDIVRGSMDGRIFEDIVRQLRMARGDTIADPVGTVERLAHGRDLTEKDQQGILFHLVTDGDLSRYGLGNAVTRYSQDLESYDRASALEVLGGEIFSLGSTDWGALVN